LLIKNGVPFDVAFSMPDDMRIAWCVSLGTLDGGEWSWPEMKWLERK
jgi:hypothetical protein